MGSTLAPLEANMCTPTKLFTAQRQLKWQSQLTTYIHTLNKATKAGTVKYGYDVANGETNCLSFAMGAVTAQTGDEIPEAMGGYNSSLSAARRLLELGYKSVADFVADRFNEESVHYAWRGDVVIIPGFTDETGNLSVGIAEPPNFWGIGPRGMVIGRMRDVLRVFRVGAYTPYVEPTVEELHARWIKQEA
jgi:hypothetical protein